MSWLRKVVGINRSVLPRYLNPSDSPLRYLNHNHHTASSDSEVASGDYHVLRYVNTNEDGSIREENIIHRFLKYPLFMLEKQDIRDSERMDQLKSSNAKMIWATNLKENAESLCLYIPMPGVLKEEDVKVSVEHKSIIIKAHVDRELEATIGFNNYMCWFDLEIFDHYKFSDIKAEMRRNSGELKLIIPRLKEEEVSVFNVNVNIKD
ncbi:ty3-gypsy retrotransposon protein [Tanacetum coccineum]